MGDFSSDDAASILAERRYQSIADILQTAVTRGGGRWTYTDIHLSSVKGILIVFYVKSYSFNN